MDEVRDEVVLSTDAFTHFDPGLRLRQRALSFIASRGWATDSISYGDQREPVVDEFGDDSPMEDGSEPEGPERWSFCFVLGLDHLRTFQVGWFVDVEAILDFLAKVWAETGCESRIEVRYRSRVWLSEYITTIDGESMDRNSIQRCIEAVTPRSA